MRARGVGGIFEEGGCVGVNAVGAEVEAAHFDGVGRMRWVENDVIEPLDGDAVYAK